MTDSTWVREGMMFEFLTLGAEQAAKLKGLRELMTGFTERMIRCDLDKRERVIREHLIAAGWTPPNEIDEPIIVQERQAVPLRLAGRR